MKNKFKILAISLTLGLFIGISGISLGQPGPPPPSEHGQGGNQAPGGAAPIGSGLVMLLGMGAAYGFKKIYNARKRLEE